MTLQHFAIKTDDAGFSAVEAALLARGQAIYGPSFQLARRPAAANATIEIIDADVDDIDLVGDLAGLAPDDPSALCRGKFVKKSQLKAFGFHMLGEAARASRAQDCPNIVWIGATNRGAQDGTSAYDTMTPERYRTIVGTSWATGTHIVQIEFEIGTWGTGTAPFGRDPDYPQAEGVPVVTSMDYLPKPGMNHTGHIHQQAGIQGGWTRPDAINHPRVWSVDYLNGFHAGEARWLVPIDPKLSTTDIYTNHVFATAASQTEVENTPLSRWVTGTTVWVHMPNDDSPAFRIGNNGTSGWNPNSYMVGLGSTPKRGLEFINTQYIGAAQSGGLSGGVVLQMPTAKFLGGRLLFGCGFKPQDVIEDGFELGMSTDGDVVFDTSDRPDPATDEGILDVIANHGSDAAEWAKMPRFLHIDSAPEGFYHHGGGQNRGDSGRVNGLLVTYAGRGHPVMESKYGFNLFGDRDSHGLGFQGSSFWTCQYFYISQAAASVVNYAVDDTASTQNIEQNTYQDFVIRDNHNRSNIFSPSAGGSGLELTGQNRLALRTNGTGRLNGNIIRRGFFDNIISAYGLPGETTLDGHALVMMLKDEVAVDHVTIKNCQIGIGGGAPIADGFLNSTFVDYPSRPSVQFALTNARFIEGANTVLFWNHRFTSWFESSPTPNLGYIRADNNRYTYVAGSNITTKQLYRMAATLQARPQWQANAKAAPPGELACIYDPNSIFEVAP